MNGPSGNRRQFYRRLGLVLGSTVAYSLVFLFLHDVANDPLVALTVVPVALAGWLFGLLPGTLAGIAGVALNALLSLLVGDFSLEGVVRWWPGEAIAVLVGVCTGLARMHLDRLKANARQLQQAHREMETELKKLARELIELQERGREAIAMDLHDGLSQLLVSAHAFLQAIESSPTADPATRHLRQRAIALLKQAVDECRTLMNDLYPRALADSGIVAAIQDELRDFRQVTGCGTTFHVREDLTLPKDVEMALYRVFHEALTNIRRHAIGTREVVVQLERAGNAVRLVVQDDGVGFDVEAAMQSNRFGGLMTMRRRVEMTGGTLETWSGAGRGTKVAAHISLVPDGAEHERATLGRRS